MRPGIGELRGQPVPRPDSKDALQRVIVGRTYGVELQNVAEVWKGLALVDIGNDIQFAALAANVTYLQYCGTPKGFLDLQAIVEEIGCAEVLADRIGAQPLRIGGSGAV